MNAIMTSRRILGFASTILLSTYLVGAEKASFSSSESTNGVTSEIPIACESGRSLADTIGFSPIDLAQARTTMAVSMGVDPKWIRLSEANLLTGECANLLSSFRPSQLRFSTSTVVRLTTEGAKIVDPPDYNSDIVANAPHPEWSHGKFVMAARVTYHTTSAGRVSTYVGLWDTGSGAMVGMFKEGEDHEFSEVRPLIVSLPPVRSISYSPTPHTGSGRIGLIQEAPEGPRLLTFFWAHGRM